MYLILYYKISKKVAIVYISLKISTYLAYYLKFYRNFYLFLAIKKDNKIVIILR